MAVTQYIGARYVPLIYQNPDDNSNTWKAGVAYDPLTIVSWAGGSYTSKSAVPAGASNPADAPEYWVSIGLYSGQTSINTNNIDHIQHALANATEAGYVCTTARAEGDLVWINGILYKCTAAVDVNDSYTEGINITQVLDVVKTITDALAQASSDISDLGNDVGDLQNDMTQAQTDIAALQANTDVPFTIMLGDSYAGGYDPNGNNDGWVEYLEDLGVSRNIKVFAGGVAFGRPASDPLSPIAQITGASLPAGVTDADVKRIVVLLGYNDFFWTDAEIKSGLRNFVTYCNTRFTNAVVYIGMAGYCWTGNTDSKTGYHVQTTARSYYDAIYGTKAVFMPQVLGVLIKDGAMSNADYKHPTEFGNKILAQAVWAALHGSTYTVHAFHSINLSSTTFATVASGVKLDISVCNGQLTGVCASSDFELTDATHHNLNYVHVNATHIPALPANTLHAGNVFQNYDFAHGLAKNIYAGDIDFYFLGYAADPVMGFNVPDDGGGNWGASNHVKVIDTKNYECSMSFL